MQATDRVCSLSVSFTSVSRGRADEVQEKKARGKNPGGRAELWTRGGTANGAAGGEELKNRRRRGGGGEGEARWKGGDAK